MSGVTELGYVRFGVSDLDAWRFFVTDLLGLELRDDINDGKLWVRIDYQHHRICIEQNDCDDLLAMGLRVAGREEFRELQGVLTEANIAFEVGLSKSNKICNASNLFSLGFCFGFFFCIILDICFHLHSNFKASL